MYAVEYSIGRVKMSTQTVPVARWHFQSPVYAIAQWRAGYLVEWPGLIRQISDLDAYPTREVRQWSWGFLRMAVRLHIAVHIGLRDIPNGALRERAGRRIRQALHQAGESGLVPDVPLRLATR